MDYILQAEQICKYLEFNLEPQDIRGIKNTIKKIFCNDLNLFGCFIKDILALENEGRISSDDYVYNDFVLCFEKYKNNNKELSFIEKIIRYSKYYISLIFEQSDDRVLLSTITSINSCYFIEYYPFVMELIDSFTFGKIDRISYALMLQLITDEVFKNFESDKAHEISLIRLRKQLEVIIHNKNTERLAI